MTDLRSHLRSRLLRQTNHLRFAKMVVAVSGGMDSMVLLHALHQALPRPHRFLVVAHFNHQLRGRDSMSDQRLVHRTAKSLNLPFITCDPKTTYNPGNGSLEMWARRERHGFLAQAARSANAPIIVTAHHADDLVESVFLRLFRGEAASLGGMSERESAPFDPGLTLWRPLLSVSRATLSATARSRRLRFREDSSNQDPSFRRNWIRTRLIPQLVGRFGQSVTTTVLRCAEILGAESEFMDAQASVWLAGAGSPDRPGFEDLPTALQRRIILKQFRSASLIPNFGHIEQLRRQPGTPVMLEGGLTFSLNAAGELVRHQSSISASFSTDTVLIDLEGSSSVQFGPVALHWRILPLVQPSQKFRPEPSRERFDADAVGPTVLLRHWRPGDRFQPIGLARASKIQNLFVSAKIPAKIRRNRVVATRPDGEIFWVEGLRMSEKFKLGPTTCRYLDWRWQCSEPFLATLVRA